jgi:hypothetical protein
LQKKGVKEDPSKRPFQGLSAGRVFLDGFLKAKT